MYSKEDVSKELNDGDAQVLRVAKTTFILRLGVMLRLKDQSATKKLPEAAVELDAASLMNIKLAAFANVFGLTLNSVRLFGAGIAAELRYRKSMRSIKKPVHTNSSSMVEQYPRPEDAAIDTYLMLPPHELRKIELQTVQPPQQPDDIATRGGGGGGGGKRGGGGEEARSKDADVKSSEVLAPGELTSNEKSKRKKQRTKKRDR